MSYEERFAFAQYHVPNDEIVTQVHQLSVAAAVEPSQERVEPDADEHSTEYQQHRVKSRQAGTPATASMIHSPTYL